MGSGWLGTTFRTPCFRSWSGSAAGWPGVRPEVRADARKEMWFLLEHVEPLPDIDGVARRYVEQMIWRSELRWHPHLVVNVRWMGLEHLAAAQARSQA